MSVVHYEAPAPLPPSRPGDEREPGPTGMVARLRAAAEYANYVAATGFVPEAIRNRPDEVAATILAGEEIGLKPMRSLAWIVMIRGRHALLAEGKRALILAAGHEIWLDESTTTRAIAAGRRKGEDRVGRVTWTLDDAKRAGLAGQPNYRSYPREMLAARATAALANAMFPDVTGGIATVEELEGLPDNGPLPEPPPNIISSDPTPPKSTRTRKRPAVTPTPPPDPQPEPDPEPPPDPASDAQLRRMFALFRDRQIEDRGERLSYSERVLGRTIKSSKELTANDASQVIDALQAEPEPFVFRVPDGVQLKSSDQAIVDEIKQALDATEEPPLPGGDDD